MKQIADKIISIRQRKYLIGYVRFCLTVVQSSFVYFSLSVDNVYACAGWLHSALMSFRFLFRGTFDALFDYFLFKKIQKISRDVRVETIIHEIRGQPVQNDISLD